MSERAKKQRMCGRKVGHPNRDAARTARFAFQRAYGERLEIYQCPYCRLWHLGHSYRNHKRGHR